jgi:hypothetical protein
MTLRPRASAPRADEMGRAVMPEPVGVPDEVMAEVREG